MPVQSTLPSALSTELTETVKSAAVRLVFEVVNVATGTGCVPTIAGRAELVEEEIRGSRSGAPGGVGGALLGIGPQVLDGIAVLRVGLVGTVADLVADAGIVGIGHRPARAVDGVGDGFGQFMGSGSRDLLDGEGTAEAVIRRAGVGDDRVQDGLPRVGVDERGVEAIEPGDAVIQVVRAPLAVRADVRGIRDGVAGRGEDVV